MNFKFGVRAHDMLSKTDIDSLLNVINEVGIPYIQLVFPKALADSSYSDENVNKIKASLNKHKVSISLLGAYFNPVHPDKSVVEKGIFNFEENLRIMKKIGAPYVGSETGSYNGSPWTYLDKNHTEEGYQETKAVFAKLVKAAEKYDGQILIEPAWAHVIYSSDVLKRLVSELDSKRVHVTIDLYNLIYKGNIDSRDEIFVKALNTFKDEVKVIHLKDAVLDENGEVKQVSPGKGLFNYPLMLKTIKECCPEAVLTFEGVKKEEIDESYTYLKNLSKNI